MSSEDSFNTPLKNPLKLPLDKLYLKEITKDGTIEIKALDKYWVKEMYYPSFSSIPIDQSNDNIEKWMLQAYNYSNAIIYFLKLSYQQFWCHAVYEPAFSIMIESFLEEGISAYSPPAIDNIGSIYIRIYCNLFAIYKRLLTPKQSETEFMLPETLGVLLYDNSVIKMENLWNLVRVYGHLNNDTLKNILTVAFDMMPVLTEHLKESTARCHLIFENIGSEAYENDDIGAKDVLMMTCLLYDTAFSIHMFLVMYPSFQMICISEDFFSKIVHVYESEIPIISKLVQSLKFDDEKIVTDNISNSEVELLNICNIMLCRCIDMVFQTQGNQVEQDKWIKTYMQSIELNIKSNFLYEYNVAFPILQDVEIVAEMCPNIRNSKVYEEIVKNFYSKPEEKVDPGVMDMAGSLSHLTVQGESEVPLPDDIVLESKISEVHDVFPHLGDGFIEKCLHIFDMDSQNVIMAILEDSLPEVLAEMDQSMPRIPPETDEPSTSLPPIMEYKGKKPEIHKNIQQLLDDKSHIRELKERFTTYGLLEDDMYDDDYDEESHEREVHLLEGDGIDDLLPKNYNHSRYPNIRGGMRNPNMLRNDGSDEEVEDEEEKSKAGPSTAHKDAFCEDPAHIRERREAKYQQKQTSWKPRDVVGNPKGQGQDKSVVVNRDNKNKKKSSGANHNRRAGAQWKRNRGMLPA